MKHIAYESIKRSITLIAIILFASGALLFAQPMMYDDDMTDEEAEYQAKRDMAAFMQYTAPYRFGDDLQPGDKMIYSMGNNEDGSPRNIHLEISEAEDANHCWVIEEFDGIEVRVLYNRSTKRIERISGIDSDGNQIERELLPESEVQDRVEMMKQELMFAAYEQITPVGWTEKEGSITVRCSFGMSNCTCYEAQYMESDEHELTDEEQTFRNDFSRMYMSEDVPRLIPSLAMMPLLDQEHMLENTREGFVKGSGFELVEVSMKKK